MSSRSIVESILSTCRISSGATDNEINLFSNDIGVLHSELPSINLNTDVCTSEDMSGTAASPNSSLFILPSDYTQPIDSTITPTAAPLQPLNVDDIDSDVPLQVSQDPLQECERMLQEMSEMHVAEIEPIQTEVISSPSHLTAVPEVAGVPLAAQLIVPEVAVVTLAAPLAVPEVAIVALAAPLAVPEVAEVAVSTPIVVPEVATAAPVVTPAVPLAPIVTSTVPLVAPTITPAVPLAVPTAATLAPTITPAVPLAVPTAATLAPTITPVVPLAVPTAATLAPAIIPAAPLAAPTVAVATPLPVPTAATLAPTVAVVTPLPVPTVATLAPTVTPAVPLAASPVTPVVPLEVPVVATLAPVAITAVADKLPLQTLSRASSSPATPTTASVPKPMHMQGTVVPSEGFTGKKKDHTSEHPTGHGAVNCVNTVYTGLHRRAEAALVTNLYIFLAEMEPTDDVRQCIEYLACHKPPSLADVMVTQFIINKGVLMKQHDNEVADITNAV
jgi:hypothetical protein